MYQLVQAIKNCNWSRKRWLVSGSDRLILWHVIPEHL